MYAQPELDKWGLFYCQNDTKIAKSFIDTMKQCFQTINYSSNPPREFPIRGNRFPEWETELKKNLGP